MTLGAFAGGGQVAEQMADGGAAVGHGDHVEAGVGAEFPVHRVVDVAQAAVVQLHGYIVLLVQAAQGQQHVGGVGVALGLGQRLTGHGLFEGGGGLVGVGLHVGDVVQPVVGGTAPHLHKELQAFIQGLHHAVDAGELAAHHVLQLVDVVRKTGLADVQRLVGAGRRGPR